MDSGRKFPTKIRLPIDAYADPGSVWHLTIGTADRQPFFLKPELARMVCEQIEWYGERYDLSIYAFCLMPDHLHLIVEVGSHNLIRTLNSFKSWTTKQAWTMGVSGQLRQTSFHDRGLRRSDDIERVAAYLFENPLRAGLVAEPEDYPWVGGTALKRDR